VRNLGSGSYDKTLRIWDAETGEDLHALTGHKDTVISVTFSPDGKRIVSESKDKTLKLWDAETGKTLYTLNPYTRTQKNTTVAFSPDVKKIISGEDRTLTLWDAETGREMLTYLTLGTVWCCAFSPNGDMDLLRRRRWKRLPPPTVRTGWVGQERSMAMAQSGKTFRILCQFHVQRPEGRAQRPAGARLSATARSGHREMEKIAQERGIKCLSSSAPTNSNCAAPRPKWPNKPCIAPPE
jgi:hypothetical protein